MASSAPELLLVSLPQLAGGAAQTLAISALGILFATWAACCMACWPALATVA
jgi:ABC-type amino acid transport system permease subunit